MNGTHDPGNESLLSEVLCLGVRDQLSPTRAARDWCAKDGFGSLEAELREFFTGPWCEELQELLDLSHLDLVGLLEQAA